MRAALVTAAVVAGLALLLAGGGRAAGGTTSLALKQIGSFDSPVYVDNAPGARHLLFVVERGGRIEVVRRGHRLSHPFLDIAGRVSTRHREQGLLSVAFDPHYERNRRFYVYYSNKDCSDSTNGCNVEVDSFRRSRRSATRAATGSRHKVIEVTHDQAPNHDGGQLQFHGGGLYAGIGDGGTQGDPEDDAQSKGSLLGKILRIDPKRRGGYTVPRGNPFVGKPGRDEIFALGLRNPWRFSFDRKSGELWTGDVGWNSWEEIDRARPAVAKGANFGWNLFVGAFPCGPCGNAGAAPPPDYVAPVHAYSHSGSGEHGDAIVGGYVVRDRSLGALRGRYLYTDAFVGNLRALDRSTNESTPLGLDAGNPSSFGEGVGGRIYVADLNGPVYRLARG